jgi:hypothetical protein
MDTKSCIFCDMYNLYYNFLPMIELAKLGIHIYLSCQWYRIDLFFSPAQEKHNVIFLI